MFFKRNKIDKWRLMVKSDSELIDLQALPKAIAEGKIAGKFLGSTLSPNTVIIQKTNKRGIICSSDIYLQEEEKDNSAVEVAYLPKATKAPAVFEGTVTFKDFIEEGELEAPLREREPDELAILLYTSGTTGKSKGVMQRDANMFYNCRLLHHLFKFSVDDANLLVLPLYHGFGLGLITFPTLTAGAKIVLVPQFDPKKIIDIMQQTGVTFFSAVPTMLIYLLAIAKTENIALPEKLKFTLCGAAPLPRETLTDFEETFNTKILEGYSLTEAGGIASVNLPADRKVFSIGKPVGEVEPELCDLHMKIVDENGNELPPNESGEIVIKSSYWKMLGYYNNPEATAEVFKDGWLYTGDLGYRDEEGYFFITDRKKDMIISGGFNVYPSEIEEVLYDHPKIMEAAVIGINHPSRGEVPKAFIVFKPGESMTEEEVIDYCTNNLARYKIPREIEVIEKLPKSAVGKINKKELHEDYKDEREL